MTENEKQEEIHSQNKFHTVCSDKLVFENVYGELDYYKKKCEIFEKDLFKSQTQIKKLELNLKKTQDINSVYGKNINNTSISFFLPSEFKTLWENYSKDLLLEAFDCLYDDYINLSHVSHDVLKITYDETNEFIKEKINSVLKVLNISSKSTDKNNSSIEDKFQKILKSIFQDYFSQIFVFTDEFNIKIKTRLISQVKEYSKLDNKDNKNLEDIIQDFIEDLNRNPFKNLIQNLFKLCIYMLLHDPILTFDIQQHSERKLNFIFYNKNSMLNIEGFGNEETPCVIILPPPLINNKHVYLGIKPAVYCLQKSLVSEHIIAECERNRNSNINHRHTNSIAESSSASTLQTNNEALSDNKLSVTPTKNTNHKLIQPTPVKSSINNSAIPATKQNNVMFLQSNNNNPAVSISENITEEKQIEAKKGNFIKIESEKTFLENNNKTKFEKKLSEPHEKKNYDRPFKSKTKQLEEIKIQPRNKILAKASFISQDNNSISGIALKNNPMNSAKRLNSGSSVNESVELNESKNGNNNSLLQINNNTKSSRSNYPASNNPGILNGKSIPIPLQNQKSPSANDYPYDSANSKNLDPNFNEEKIHIKKSETYFKNNLLQKETKFSSHNKADSLLNPKDKKANPSELLDNFQFTKYEKNKVETFSPKKLNSNNDCCYTNINNISRKNNSEKLTSEKLTNYPVNINSLNRMTPKEIKIERRIYPKNIENISNLYEDFNKNNKVIDDKIGNLTSQIKINRIRDNTRTEQDKLNQFQANSASNKFTAINKENINIVSSKTQKLDIESLIGNGKYSNNEVKNKMQKFYNVLISNHERESDKDNLISTNKNLVGRGDNFDKK